MDFSKQFENNEQRCRFASAGFLTRTMPGSQLLPDGQHIFGAIPTGAVIESFRAFATGWDGDITVNIGTVGNPTEFLAAAILVDGVSQFNDATVPLELFFPEGEELVVEITAGNVGTEGQLEFMIDYSELDTQAGKYTA